MKVNILRLVLIILLLCTFYVIFGFSSQNSKQSGSLSEKITTIIVEKLNIVEGKTKQEKEIIINKLERVIRKLAHFSIYTLVGLLLMGFTSTYKLENIKKVMISLIIGIVYAISDEIHQSFVPGRSPQFTDVMIDTMGVTLGILLIMLAIEIYHKQNDIKHENYTKKLEQKKF